MLGSQHLLACHPFQHPTHLPPLPAGIQLVSVSNGAAVCALSALGNTQVAVVNSLAVSPSPSPSPSPVGP